MKSLENKKAIVLLSGGVDSATCLAIAKENGYECWALSFNYGQRSSCELDAARRLAQAAKVLRHKIIDLNIGELGGSALTDITIEIPEETNQGIPLTYVPARNTIFLSYALAWAEVIKANSIYIGVNALDYSGYPDCRPEFISVFQKLVNLATKTGVEGGTITVETPLIDLKKSEIIQRGVKLGVDYSDTISCYQADEKGNACGMCDSCRFRKKGFVDAGIRDPTRYTRT